MKLPNAQTLGERWLKLMTMLAALRAPEGGCAWNQQQTHSSLMPYCLEEAYELLATVAADDAQAMQQELGDLLWQVLFHVQIAMENDAFGMLAVLDGLTEKMLRRHPHVFSDGEAHTLGELRQQWAAIKAAEGQQEGTVAKVGDGQPPLVRAAAVQHAARQQGFDWPTWQPVLAQLKEEIAELEEALAQQDAAGIEDEFGDVLFSAVNLSRHLQLDANMALSRSTNKFVERFNTMLQLAGGTTEKLDDEQWDALWVRAKELLRRST